MTLGKEGVSGNGPDTFDRPTGVAIAPQRRYFCDRRPRAERAQLGARGEVFEGWEVHQGLGTLGPAPGDFDEPHDIFIGGSQERVYVADRKNSRIQVFDQDGNFIAAWKQFGQPSSVFVGKDDTIYVGAAFPDPAAKKGELRGIVVGNAKGRLAQGVYSRPGGPGQVGCRDIGVGIAADDTGTIYAADVAAHNLRKYVKVASDSVL